MSKRKVITTVFNPTNNLVAKVFDMNEWGEFEVAYFEDGVQVPSASYYTDCKDDAIATAKEMVK